MNKKETDEKLERLKIFRNKIILRGIDDEIQGSELCFLKGWIDAIIKSLELYFMLFEFYPKALMEKKGKAIEINLVELEKAMEDLKRR